MSSSIKTETKNLFVLSLETVTFLKFPLNSLSNLHLTYPNLVNLIVLFSKSKGSLRA